MPVDIAASAGLAVAHRALELLAASPYVAAAATAAQASGSVSAISAAAAAAAAAAPVILAAAAGAAPAVSAVSAAVSEALAAHKKEPVQPLYTEEDLDPKSPEIRAMCDRLNPPEPGLAYIDAYEVPVHVEADPVASIKSTLEIVLEAGPFEKRVCGLDLERRIATLAELVAQVDFWSNTELVMNLAVAFASTPTVRDAMSALVKAHARPPEPVPTTWLKSLVRRNRPVTHPALALRQCEVAARALGVEAPAEFVAHVRERTWGDWIAGKLAVADLRFFGYEFIEAPGAMSSLIRVPIPDPKQSNAHWAMELASSAAATLYPDVVAQYERIQTIVTETAPRLRYAGFERPGVGYAMLGAAEMRGMLAKYDATYARALETVLRYMAALLGQTPTEAEIKGVVGKLGKPVAVAPAAPTKHPAECALVIKNPEINVGRNYRANCAQYERDARRRRHAASTVDSSPGVDALFDIFDDIHLLDAERLKTLRTSLKGHVEKLLEGPPPKEKRRKVPDARTLRRLEVLCTRLGLEAPSANSALLSQITTNADNGKPHGLAVHELGCEHTVLRVGDGSFVPSMYTPGALAPGWVSRWSTWLFSGLAARAAETLAPGALAAATQLREDTTATRQYKAREEPGTAYVLLKLLELLDYATARGFAEVKEATLAAVRSLLASPALPPALPRA